MSRKEKVSYKENIKNEKDGTEKMDFKYYFDLVKEKKFTKATEYKNSFIPKNLYKYYSLDGAGDLDESKLQCLKENKIYLSDINSFNDPFEGKFLIYDYKKSKKLNWDRTIIDKYLSDFKNHLKCSCLSDTDEQNMPMWAYYANNHQGYCVEYEFNDEEFDYIYPVLYEPNRKVANSIITKCINLTDKSFDNDELSGDAFYYQEMLFILFSAKCFSWRHEKEYRIMIYDNNYFTATPKKIFIGKDCKYKEKIIKIGKSLKSKPEIYEMSYKEDEEKFCLYKKKINY